MMGRRGPKRLSSDELRARGSRLAKQRRYDERAVRATVKNELPRLGNPPTWLSAGANRIWRKLVPMLAEVGDPDESIMAVFCDSAAQYIEATQIVAKEGLTLKSKKHGATVKHPLHSTLNQLRATIIRYSAELGLSPASRNRLGWVFVPDDDDTQEPEEESIEDFAARKPRLVPGRS